MRVANALNNHIRILFNPKVESFKLFDFLMVKSDDNRYIAQIIEIYDDKFDSSQNVAKLKLFYKVNKDNEVIPYDDFTPSKECEISRLNQDEIENFINNDKETFPFAKNVKSLSPLNIQYDFFNNNAVVLGDKLEHTNSISLNLAALLKEKNHVVLIDTTGVIENEEARKITASYDFKLPLNYNTIEYLYDICLPDASLEFAAVGTQIFNEIKKFAKAQTDGFIPFSAFTKVISKQYKATPYPELKLLLARMQRLQFEEIFARTKKEKLSLAKTISKSPLTIINLANIPSVWQKAYMEFIVDEIGDDVYFISRVNDENFDVDLINKIYNKKKNFKFVPCVSYNYKKLPTIVQYCKNYILMSSMHQRDDFLDANFTLSNLVSQNCIIFGENTDGFLYLAKDWEYEAPKKKINYRKIALNLMKEDGEDMSGFESDLSEEKSDEALENLDKELDVYENIIQKPEINTQEKEEIQPEEKKEEVEAKPTETFSSVWEDNHSENTSDNQISQEFSEVELDFFETPQEEPTEIPEKEITKEPTQAPTPLVTQAPTQVPTQTPTQVPIQTSAPAPIETPTQVLEEVSTQAPTPIPTAAPTSAPTQEDIEDREQENTQEENVVIDDIEYKTHSDEYDEDLDIDIDVIQDIKEQEESAQDNIQAQDDTQSIIQASEDILTIAPAEIPEETPAQEPAQEPTEIPTQEPAQEIKQEVTPAPTQVPTQTPDEVSIEDTPDEKTKEPIQVSVDIENIKIEENQDDINLSKLADESMDTSFEEIINEKSKDNETSDAQGFEIDENTKLTVNLDSDLVEKENLPIFKEEQKAPKNTFEKGDIVLHSKYGRGEITKVIEYNQSQLLQIQFEQAGKKLLDPRVAEITLEQ